MADNGSNDATLLHLLKTQSVHYFICRLDRGIMTGTCVHFVCKAAKPWILMDAGECIVALCLTLRQ